MNSIAANAINTPATSVSLCLSLTAQAQYNPTGSYQGNTGIASPDWQTSAAGAAAAASSAASAGMNNAVANAATGANTAASYQQNASAQFLQSSAPASSFGQSGTGYTNDGTLMMGGNKIGNPHQILHDAQASSLFGITAVRYTFTDVPTYGQGTLAQIQTDMTNAPISSDPTRLFSRLYLTATNPYTQGVATPHNNYQTYQGVVADAQAGSYQLTVADDNKLYAFKTLSAPNQQAMNILIKELPNTSQFKGSTDLKGGATGVHVTQSGDAAALQNYLATVKPYDFSWRSAMGAWADGNARPSNITAELGQFGNMPIGSNEAGAVFANWVMGSNQVQTYQAGLQNQSMQTGNEGYGVLAWDANQNRYVMLDSTNTQATAGSVSGNMPTLGDNQFGFFGMHTHPGNATLSDQDFAMTQQLGLDQMVIGNNGSAVIFTNNPSNNWQGQGFEFERPGDRYATSNSAAHAALDDINMTSIMVNLEYGGTIGIDNNGYYTYSDPIQGTPNGVASDKGVLPAGYDRIGNYHTHADYSSDINTRSIKQNDQFNSDNFSPADKDNAVGRFLSNPTYQGTYLGTPSGVYYVYNPSTDTTSTLTYSSWSTSASTYNSSVGDDNHAPGTSYNSHVNGF